MLSPNLRHIRKNQKQQSDLRARARKLERRDNMYILCIDQVEENNGDGNWRNVNNAPSEISLGVKKWCYFVVRHWASIAFTKSSSFWDQVFPHIYAVFAVTVGMIRGIYCG